MNKKINFFLSGLFIFISCFCFSQNKADSLLSLLKKDKEDTSRVNHLNALGKELMYRNPDTAIALSNQALSISKKLAWKQGISNSYGSLGVFNWIKSDYQKSLDFYLKAIEIDKELNSKSDMAMHLSNIGLVYTNEADFPKALDYYLKALKIDEELKDKGGIEADLGNIGIVYYHQADLNKALDYYLKALNMAEELKNNHGTAIDLVNIGNVYYDQNNYQKALDYYFKSLKISEKFGYKQLEANTLCNIGVIYRNQANANHVSPQKSEELQSKALDYYFKSLKIAEEGKDKNGVATDLENIGSLYTSIKKYTEAFDYIYHALALSDSIGAKDNVEESYNYLSTLYEKSTIPLRDTIGGKILTMEKMRLKALHYFKSYLAMRDTIFSEENKKQLVRKELNYQFDKKEALTKANADKQAAVAASESKKQKIIIWSVISVLILVIVFASAIFRALSITKRQKQMIEHQKIMMEEKQKEILDSIHYAKRIQTSLLPTAIYIERTLTRLKIKR